MGMLSEASCRFREWKKEEGDVIVSVIVRGMELPTECEYCPLCRYYPENGNVWCNAKNRILKRKWGNPNWTHLDVKKPEWCPLFEVKDWREV